MAVTAIFFPRVILSTLKLRSSVKSLMSVRWAKLDAAAAPFLQGCPRVRGRCAGTVGNRNPSALQPAATPRRTCKAQEAAFLTMMNELTPEEQEELYQEMLKLVESRPARKATVLSMPPMEPRPERQEVPLGLLTARCWEFFG
jgi:hypothetical protein